MQLFLGKYSHRSPLLLFWNFSLLNLVDTHLSLHSHPFVMAMLLGFIPAFLVGLLPALRLWDIDANFMGDGNTTLLRHLLADSVAGTLLKWDLFAHFFSLEMLLVCLLDVDRSSLDLFL